jgi:FkbM family methyltransferase
MSVSSGITFRDDFGAWWPDYDHKPENCHRAVLRGLSDMDHAIARCRQRRRCVQAGGHAGFWPRRLSPYFREVTAFEPEPALHECMRRNLDMWGARNVEPRREALSDRTGGGRMLPHPSAGSWRVASETPLETVPVDLVRLDDFGFADVDALLLDVEGHEARAISGAVETIRRSWPVILVEVLPGSAAPTRAVLAGLGYGLAARAHKDEVYVRTASA